MPRKSAASISNHPEHGASTAIGPPTGLPSNTDGDTTMLSVATEASTSAKHSKSKEDKDKDSHGIDDLLLPRTLTSRLARGILPANTSLQKDAILALTKAATVFISYLASHANELTTRKTIGPLDVLAAVKEIEMDKVMGIGQVAADGIVGGRLEREISVFEGVVRGKRKGYREKVKARESAQGVATGEGDGERDAKRAKVEGREGASGEANVHDSSIPTSQQQQHNHQGLPNGQHTAPQTQVNGSATETGRPHQRPAVAAPDGEEEGYRDVEEEEEEGADGEMEVGVDDDTEEEEDEDDEDDEDEEEDEKERENEDEDGYGPDDQLRHDMNGDESSEESD